MKVTIVVRYLALLQLGVALHAYADSMKNYTIDFPEHILRYSLPREIAEKIEPLVQEKQLSQFSPLDKNFIDHGYLQIAGTLHDFNGPFWVGAYASLKFDFMVQRRSHKFNGEIYTLDGLDKYIRWWTNDGDSSHRFNFGRVVIGKSEWLSRSQNNFSDPTSTSESQRKELEIISIPINNDMFLEVGFSILEWVPGSAKKWKPEAERLRETIKSTVALEPKK